MVAEGVETADGLALLGQRLPFHAGVLHQQARACYDAGGLAAHPEAMGNARRRLTTLTRRVYRRRYCAGCDSRERSLLGAQLRELTGSYGSLEWSA